MSDDAELATLRAVSCATARAVRTAVAQNLGDETDRSEAGERYRLRRTRHKERRCAAAFGALAPRPLRGRRTA